ncbi:MAG: TIGR00341 family protein, partial [Anaerolineae bacterium]|nr:TIGR00341 family protein [Anaerolineae bacterium]
MRQLLVQVPPDEADRVLELASRHDALNSLILPARDRSGNWAYVVIHVANSAVGPLLDELEQLSQLHVTLAPNSVIPMKPPRSEVADQIHDVTPRSPVEVWLNGLQSVGSWKGFLAYVAAAAVVVWIGMITGTIYLLVAA